MRDVTIAAAEPRRCDCCWLMPIQDGMIAIQVRTQLGVTQLICQGCAEFFIQPVRVREVA